jgi:hypothetical protein
MGMFGVTGALWLVAGLGIVSVSTFAAIALLPRTDPEAVIANSAPGVA